MNFESMNPATEEIAGNYNFSTPAEIDMMLDRSLDAFKEIRELSFAERAACFQKLAELLRAQSVQFGDLMAREMGKPRLQGKGEAEKCALVCEYYAQNAETFLEPRSVLIDNTESRILFEPLGPLLAIMPWNFPFWQVLRCAAPMMMAGNTIILKHAPNVPDCSLALEKLFQEAGFPEFSFQNSFADLDGTRKIIEDFRVRGVTLTGSTEAGKKVAALAGGALKKTVLELGGSDPYLLLADCDLERAVDSIIASRLLNSGQSCIAAKRFIVAEQLKANFEELLLEKLKPRVTGDPLGGDVDQGPLARRDLRDKVADQVQRSLKEGAVQLYQGDVPAGKGFYYPVTVLTEARRGVTAWDEEIFGPVFSVTYFQSESDVLDLANQTEFGLGAGIFTKDPERAKIFAAGIDAGNVFINDFVKSDPRLPFGGVKNSGYGRELSTFGMTEFVNVKTMLRAL